MTNIFGQLIEDRIKNDLSSLEEAEHNLSAIINDKFDILHTHYRDNRGALLDMLKLLEIDNQDITDDEDILDRFKEILYANDYTYTVVKLDDGWWKNSYGHMLGVSSSGQLIPLMSKKLGYYEGRDGKINKVDKSILQEEINHAFCFFKTLPARKITISEFFRFALRRVSKYRIAYVILVSLAISLLNMAIPYATKSIFDEVIPSGDSSAILPIMVALVGLALSEGLLTTVRNIVTFSIKDSMFVTMQAALLHRVMHLKPIFFKDKSAATVGEYVLSVVNISEVLNEQIITSVLSLIVGCAFVYQIGYYSHFTSFTFVIYTLLLLNILAVYAGLYIRSRRRVNAAYPKAKTSGALYNFFQGIQKIKTNAAEARVFNIWSRLYAKSEPMTWADTVIIELSPAFYVLCIFFIVIMVPHTDLTLSDYAAFLVALVGFIGVINKFTGPLINNIAKLTPAVRLIKPILEAVPEVDKNSKFVRNLSGSIRITGLNFRYSDTMPQVISDLDININAGEYVAIVGPSGCGKSTLMRLMLGFEKPVSGSVFYDHYNVATVNKSSLRKHLGICLQGGRLFAGSILDNVRISNPLATEEEVWEALHMAAIDEEVRSMTDGIHHQLDASGTGISGGQRQRILIARALLNRPAVVFLDEATSALDNLSQRKVIENMSQLNCTRITIAHRLSTIRDCDRIIVINKGHVVEEGTFDTLMARQGLFYEIAKRQGPLPTSPKGEE